MHKFQLINQALLEECFAQAKYSPRLRKNYNFHTNDQDKSHRLLNAIEPGSYIVPHRHLDPNKDETMLIIAGRMGLIIFDDEGNVTVTVELAPAGENKGINLLSGCYHTVLALEPNTVFFESKAGPYMPLLPAEIASWAPADNSPAALAYYQQLRQLFAR